MANDGFAASIGNSLCRSGFANFAYHLGLHLRPLAPRICALSGLTNDCLKGTWPSHEPEVLLIVLVLVWSTCASDG